MPCKCSGLRLDKCKCKLLGTRYTWKPDVNTNSMVLLATNSFCYQGSSIPKKPGMFIRLLEHLYDKCAGYNLRYCPFRGFVKNDSYMSNTLKDLVILACFIIANLVVLLAILMKTTFHIFYLCMQSAYWVKGRFSSKIAEDSLSVMSKPNNRHDYSPPVTYKFISN